MCLPVPLYLSAYVQNLKVASESGKAEGLKENYRNYNGYRILTDWKKEVQDEIVAASLTKDESLSIRQQIQQLKESSETQTIQGAEGVQKALESRVKEVTSFKQRLEESIDLVSAELSTLHRSELKLTKVLKRKQRQLELNEERMMIRTDRPAREYTIDDVQGRLQVRIACSARPLVKSKIAQRTSSSSTRGSSRRRASSRQTSRTSRRLWRLT